MPCFRVENDLGEINCAFFLGKARCSPNVTIPRLELTVAVLSVRVANMSVKEIGVLLDN